MCYKISNIASKEAIEKAFNVSFKFPKLHTRNPIIDGLSESVVSVITQNRPQELSLAIWGILPEAFQDDWQHFQNVKNTLNVDLSELEEDPKYKGSLTERRCLVIVTGFFTYYLHDGELYPYYVYLESKKPFALAGVYNELEDGFKTCSIITSKANTFIRKIHNSDTLMPVVLDESNYHSWISETTDKEVVKEVIDISSYLEFKAYPIAKEFHKNGVVYDSLLDPVEYQDIPRGNA